MDAAIADIREKVYSIHGRVAFIEGKAVAWSVAATIVLALIFKALGVG